MTTTHLKSQLNRSQCRGSRGQWGPPITLMVVFHCLLRTYNWISFAFAIVIWLPNGRNTSPSHSSTMVFHIIKKFSIILMAELLHLLRNFKPFLKGTIPSARDMLSRTPNGEQPLRHSASPFFIAARELRNESLHLSYPILKFNHRKL
jgi:hypothetical protein